ncbi:protein gar2-like isoform X2 [Phoenix dactylifera]|uniref:Protein gar2-like isoform X2 n=1 Tax=Phoenix dactylifera TaxID=42345 RepID=A0A8B8Z856_PHODC|nr:protein gar2-like isoform X2 [Phoenix dactylifera]XP_038970229.1 protein gar2-like isoform X2 [Phoenix dactylifera]XP_038970230.1 protein gar2-like isoform X2 [Phoenix dactylifera]
MAPKRRVVRTVRKSTAKSKTPASKSAAAAAKTPASQSTPSVTPPRPADSATPISPAATESPSGYSGRTAAAETPAADPASAPENVTPKASEPGSSAPENVTPKTSEPVASETVKVVKKNIIKKRVPTKASSAAKEEEKAQEAAVDLVAAAAAEIDLPVSAAEETPAQQSEPKKAGADEAVSVDHAQQEDAMETENPDSREENKDVLVEQHKGEAVEAATRAAPGDDEVGISERQRRRKTEIFIGGLDRDAKEEEDISGVFGKVGEIVEVRMMMDGQTGKNKGYCFLRYKEAAQAMKAVAEFAKVEALLYKTIHMCYLDESMLLLQWAMMHWNLI